MENFRKNQNQNQKFKKKKTKSCLKSNIVLQKMVVYELVV
jgi:hypothetical protein